MPALSLAPVLSFFAAFQRVSPVVPLRTFLRTTSDKLRPSRPVPFAARITSAQSALLAAGRARPDQLATVLHEPQPGAVPTIVLGGFVPDATEQVFLLRGHLLKSGALYYLNYPPGGFSLDLLCAQLDDLVAELRLRHGLAPVIFSVSFGCGLLLEWLRRQRAAGREAPIAGAILISPVACTADLLTPGEAKPSTLLGRALQPYLQATGQVTEATIEKSRAIFARMFEAGAQNKESLAFLLTRAELAHLRAHVLGTIRCVTPNGARERVQALCTMPALGAAPADSAPLCTAPVLILYAEKESAVLVDSTPTRRALESDRTRHFPASQFHVVTNPHGAPVQHASLIFHCFNFLPHLSAFYRRLKTRKLHRAA